MQAPSGSASSLPHVLSEGVRLFARTRWRPHETTVDEDSIVVEEPLEIRFGAVPLAVVMRTPGNDIELVTGFCVTEQIARFPTDIERIDHCSVGAHSENIIVITPSRSSTINPNKFSRNLYTTSSCGVCGKRSLDQALKEAAPLTQSNPFAPRSLAQAPELLRQLQLAFSKTGAIHAAGLMNPDGSLAAVREDIGRHNAVDKVIGWACRDSFSLENVALVVSGRASFEIVQKALAARIPGVVAVGGVSSLAIELAQRARITLAGFAMPERLSFYAGAPA